MTDKHWLLTYFSSLVFILAPASILPHLRLCEILLSLLNFWNVCCPTRRDLPEVQGLCPTCCLLPFPEQILEVVGVAVAGWISRSLSKSFVTLMKQSPPSVSECYFQFEVDLSKINLWGGIYKVFWENTFFVWFCCCCCLKVLFIYFRERTRVGRSRGTGRCRLHTEPGARCEARSHNPLRSHPELNFKRWSLNQGSHPGAPAVVF